jgi:hypothetical protein
MLKNVLAFAAVRGIDAGVRWYKMVLDRGPCRFSITLVETNMDERMKMLTVSGHQAKIVRQWRICKHHHHN